MNKEPEVMGQDKYRHEQEFWNEWVKISEDYIQRKFNYVIDENFIPLGHPWPESRKYMFDLVGDATGKDVLDCGAGTGWVSIILAKKGAREVIAIDVSDGMLAFAEKLAQMNGVGSVIQTQNIAVEDATFETESFDVICCSNVLHHVDLPATLDKIHKWLKPGGRAVFCEPLANSACLTRLRNIIPIKRVGTDTERGLTLKEILQETTQFSDVTYREYQLLSRLDRVIKKEFFRKKLLTLDGWLLKHFAFLRYYARIIVFRVSK